MTMQTILSWKEKRSPMWCLLVRALLVVVYFAAFITYIVFGILKLNPELCHLHTHALFISYHAAY